MTDDEADLLLDALECVLLADVDPFAPRDLPPGSDDLMLGSCSADGFAMIGAPDGAYRPWNVGRGVPCPGDTRMYPTADGMRLIGNCRPETFQPWRPGRRA